MVAGRVDAFAAAPQLPPEIWNLAVVLTICVLLGWLTRLLWLALIVAELRFAVESQAVLHLKDLGVSLQVLRSASMWHFHQLLRTTTEATSTKMARVRIPFDVVSSSIDIKRCASAGGSSSVLNFKVRSNVPCLAQVFWGVHSESLDALAVPSGFSARTAATDTAASIVSPRQLLSPVLRQVSTDRAVRALRSVPSRLGSRIRRQRRRHELQDDNTTADSNESEQLPANGHSPSDPVFTAQSDTIRCDPSQADSDTVSVPVPLVAMMCPAEEEVRSLMEEVDNHSPSGARASATATPATPPAPRFSAVIVLRSCQGSQDTSKSGLLGMLSSRPSTLTDATAVVCQCVALDFLPTPLKLERFTPAVVKKTSYTRSTAYTSQEIYGRDASSTSSECAICLEGVVSVVLLPCRHFCVCRVCLAEIDRCPICRAAFVTYVDCDDRDSEAPDSALQLKMGSAGN